MRVVLDTNVIVSAYLPEPGVPAKIVAAWRAGAFDLLVSAALLAEYAGVLGYVRIRERHRMTSQQIELEVKAIEQDGLLVEPGEVRRVVADDPDDDQVLACAAAGRANYIVSGDRHLLSLHEYLGIRILRPAAFVALLESAT
jgi:putative PIN family toxin of toxin-antitoxin system